MKVQDRGYFEECFAANFDVAVQENRELTSSKTHCTGALEKTLDEAFRTLPLSNVEVKLTDIGTEFIRRVTALKEARTLSEVAFLAAKNAITKTIGDCDPNIMMFRKGVRHFCQNAGAARAGKHLFLVTARNAMILHEPLSNLVQRGLEGRSPDGLKLFNDFFRAFETLSNEEIVAAENALNAFDNGGSPPESNAVMQQLDALGVNRKSSYIETPQYLFGYSAQHLREFLDKEIQVRRRMVDMAIGTGWHAAQSTGKADHSVCNGVMSLARRYIPNAEGKLKSGLNYQEKVAVLNPVIDKWERENLELFSTTIRQIRECIDSIIKQEPIIMELVLVQSKKVRAVQAIVDKSRVDLVGGWSARLNTKEWGECVSNLNPMLKREFIDINIKTINLAFQRASSTVENPAFGEGPEAISLRNGRLAQNGLGNTLISTLVLVWLAVHDRTKVLGANGKELLDSDENRLEIDRIIKEKEINLVRAFWEYQTEYGYGKACGHGSYNKIVESLSLTDPDVIVGNDVDVNFQRILEIVDNKFIKELVLQTAKNFDKQALYRAWESKTPSIEERALIKEFRAVLHRKLIDELPAVLETEFTDFYARLEHQYGTESFLLQTLIPAIEKTIEQHVVAEAPPLEAWMRPFLAEETYEQALRTQNPALTPERKVQNALKAVFKNQIARRMERVLLTSGMPIHRQKSDVDDFDDDAECYAKSWAEELVASAQDEKFNAEQAITELVNSYKGLYVGNLAPDSTNLISRLVMAFSSAKQCVEKQHVLKFRDVSGFLGGTDARRFENVEVAKPYAGFHVPLLPSVFPYNSMGDERLNFGVPSFSVAATVQLPLKEQVPAGVLEQLEACGVSLDNLQMFFCVQNMPWNRSAFLFRPHSWLKPDAPASQLNYNYSCNIQAGISDIGTRFPQLGAINDVRVFATNNQDVVYSGEPQFTIQSAQNSNDTHCFYSLCVDNSTTPKRAALTLHWLLNDKDQAQISALLPEANTPDAQAFTLEAFSKRVEALGPTSTLNKPINGTSPVKALNAMLQGGQPQAQPLATQQQYRLFEQPENQVAPAAARPVFHFREEEIDEKLPREVAERRNERARLLQETEARRPQEEAARQERLRQDVARQAELARQQAAEAARQAEARRVEAERQAAAAHAPAVNLNTVRRR